MEKENEDTEEKVVNLLSGAQIGALVAQWLRIHVQCRSHEMVVQSLGWEDFVRGGNDNDSSILSTHAGRINRGPGRGEEVASGWRHQGC